MTAPHRDPRLLGVVFVGGCVGTFLRSSLSTAFEQPRGSFPWTTLLINLVGAYLLGVLLETLASRGSDDGVRRLLRLGVGTGVLGGFTTYSTFMVETTGLRIPAAVAYVVGTVVLGLAAATLGLRSARWVASVEVAR
ncbi:fluoride efflux transporter FluC [Calidifontibacter terrae]